MTQVRKPWPGDHGLFPTLTRMVCHQCLADFLKIFPNTPATWCYVWVFPKLCGSYKKNLSRWGWEWWRIGKIEKWLLLSQRFKVQSVVFWSFADAMFLASNQFKLLAY